MLFRAVDETGRAFVDIAFGVQVAKMLERLVVVSEHGFECGLPDVARPFQGRVAGAESPALRQCE